MKILIISIFVFSFISIAETRAQNIQNDKTVPLANQSNSLEAITQELADISKSVEMLNQRLKGFSETFTSNQGLRLTDRQQKLLIAFEFLNRAEQRLTVLQKSEIEMSEKRTSVKVRIAKVEEELRPETIDRSIAVVGTTNAEEVREIRRQALYRQKSELLVLLNEIQTNLSETASEIRQTESFLKNIRQRIFPEIAKELSDL